MHVVLQNIVTELEQIVTALNTHIASDEPFNVMHSNWSFPGITKSELIDAAESLKDLIQARGLDILVGNELRIADYPRRLEFLRTNMPQNISASAAVAIPNYFATLDALKRALEPSLKNDATAANEASATLKTLSARIRSLETTLSNTEPKANVLAEMVTRIVNANETADRLPVVLQDLEEATTKISGLRKQAEDDGEKVSDSLVKTQEYQNSLKNSNEEAKNVIDTCNTAYAAATSHGLAAAFTERSKALDNSMWAWVIGLLGALIAGGYFGSQQLDKVAKLTESPSVSASMAFLNLALAIFSVGAPIWFGWLATKQIGQRFRLAEDYAFKASVSRAYEGYRREASRIDKDIEASHMEASLLASALSRLDEQPLRLVEESSHGSPWHELASSEPVQTAFKSVPGFANSILELAKSSLTAATSTKKSNDPQIDPSDTPTKK